MTGKIKEAQNPLKVLIVEEDQSVADMIVVLLKTIFTEVEAVIALFGEQAVEDIGRIKQLDLLIVSSQPNTNMGVDGVEVIRAAVKKFSTKVKVLALSASSIAEFEVAIEDSLPKGEKPMRMSCLQKPFLRRGFLTALSRII